MKSIMKGTLKAGDWVEVKSKDAILRTLDADGALDGMPWMPEMFRFCGERFQVFKRAHKSCDYTTPYPYGSRSLTHTVLLETRCDGSAHGGCQAGCTILWKEAWLNPVGDHADGASASGADSGGSGDHTAGCDEFRIWSGTRVDATQAVPKYRCQMTELPKASKPLSWWDVRQYLEDVWSGNVSIGRLATGFVYSLYYHLSEAGIGVGPSMRWLYNKLASVRGGSVFPRTRGSLPEGSPTPSADLDLQPGELVRVKSHKEILQTVTTTNVNRGMYWDAELVPYCGGTYKVLKRVTRIISERTGRMLEMKTPCVVLDEVVCQARYSSCRMFCPRAMYPYWREIWLDRVEAPASGVTEVHRSSRNAQ